MLKEMANEYEEWDLNSEEQLIWLSYFYKTEYNLMSFINININSLSAVSIFEVLKASSELLDVRCCYLHVGLVKLLQEINKVILEFS